MKVWLQVVFWREKWWNQPDWRKSTSSGRRDVLLLKSVQSDVKPRVGRDKNSVQVQLANMEKMARREISVTLHVVMSPSPSAVWTTIISSVAVFEQYGDIKFWISSTPSSPLLWVPAEDGEGSRTTGSLWVSLLKTKVTARHRVWNVNVITGSLSAPGALVLSY